MDSQTTVKTLTEHPLQYRAFVQNNILKDASFSSYLKPEEHSPDDSEINVFDAKKYFSESNESSPTVQKNIVDNQCELASGHRHSSVSSVDNAYGRNFRVNSFRATPTASSEASWNSQTGLLANPPGAIAVSLRGINTNEKKRGSFSSTRKWFFCRKCPCSGKKSVQIEETSSEPRTEIGSEQFPVKHTNKVVVEKSINISQKNSIEIQQRVVRPQSSETHVGAINKIGTIQRRSTSESSESTHATATCQQRVLAPVRPFTETPGGGFSFPILNNSGQAKLEIKSPPTRRSVSPILEDPPRESLEVFQPSSRKSTETDHRRCNNFPFPGSPISRVTATDDDVASDASSDLFEIESFSTSIATSSCPLYRQRNSLEEPGTPSIAATECYAPSEVSIDWSVTTAEGFDRASVTNYSTISEIETNTRFFGGNGGGGGDGGKWKGGGLLSCRHEKAVNVGPQPVKYGSPNGLPQLPLINTAEHVGSKAMPRANKPPLASSHSARLSVAFAA
ncbi:protein PHYTOCHROME KINASE SUBSTRATE 4 [Solanum dulcamara]|uniref:protein PHYTOCHROME KINASE SUBSTRATE 4 n=1 Tax=Solanum dulcamara TaxID=45834 RepID=UPI002485A916|nr:protein PHYTOCHROME KINASE SUBSTRATE 4 [Solanum dulcamara]